MSELPAAEGEADLSRKYPRSFPPGADDKMPMWVYVMMVFGATFIFLTLAAWLHAFRTTNFGGGGGFWSRQGFIETERFFWSYEELWSLS